MQEWADYLDRLEEGEKADPIPAALPMSAVRGETHLARLSEPVYGVPAGIDGTGVQFHLSLPSTNATRKRIDGDLMAMIEQAFYTYIRTVEIKFKDGQCPPARKGCLVEWLNKDDHLLALVKQLEGGHEFSVLLALQEGWTRNSNGETWKAAEPIVPGRLTRCL